MPAGTYNFAAEQGATLQRTIQYLDSSENPIDLSDYDAFMQVRLTASNASTILSLTSGAEITLGGAAGTIEILVAATTLSAIAPLKYVYDLELHHQSNGTVIRLIQGAFNVSAEVTR
jgi:hypothetical protein